MNSNIQVSPNTRHTFDALYGRVTDYLATHGPQIETKNGLVQKYIAEQFSMPTSRGSGNVPTIGIKERGEEGLVDGLVAVIQPQLMKYFWNGKLYNS